MLESEQIWAQIKVKEAVLELLQSDIAILRRQYHAAKNTESLTDYQSGNAAFYIGQVLRIKAGYRADYYQRNPDTPQSFLRFHDGQTVKVKSVESDYIVISRMDGGLSIGIKPIWVDPI